MANRASMNKRDTKRPGRPRLNGEEIHVTFRLRRGRSIEEDTLMDRLGQLKQKGQRSRFIRRVLTTGEIDPILDREFARETERVSSALDAMASLWSDDDDNEE